MFISCRLFFTGQNREQWIYKDIYEIHGTEKTEAVAVQINDRYYIAKRQWPIFVFLPLWIMIY